MKIPNVLPTISFVVLASFASIQRVKAGLIGWAVQTVKAKVSGSVINTVSSTVFNCAMSTSCLSGQDIIMVTHYIPERAIFEYTGRCFESKDINQARIAGSQVAKAISRKSGVPIVFSFVTRDRIYVFGVPR